MSTDFLHELVLASVRASMLFFTLGLVLPGAARRWPFADPQRLGVWLFGLFALAHLAHYALVAWFRVAIRQIPAGKQAAVLLTVGSVFYAAALAALLGRIKARRAGGGRRDRLETAGVVVVWLFFMIAYVGRYILGSPWNALVLVWLCVSLSFYARSQPKRAAAASAD